MGIYLDPADVPGVQNAETLIRELDGELILNFPCLATLSPENLVTLKGFLVPVIQRWSDIGTGVTTTESTGPFSRGKSTGGGHVLWEHERARLRALCGQGPGSSAGLPRGEFPPADPVDDLFARRPQWPRLGAR